MDFRRISTTRIATSSWARRLKRASTGLKQQVEWGQTEPIEKGGYDWRELDKVVAAVSSAGVNLLLSVVRAPGWALGEGAHGPPADPQDFEDFMRVISARYRGAVQAYELWNEANLSREWGLWPYQRRRVC